MKLKNQRGQGTVEMAFAIVFLLIFMFPVVDLTKIAYNWLGLQYAVNEGARVGSITTVNRENTIRTKVTDIASSLNISPITVTFTDEEGGATAGASLEFYTLSAYRDVPISNLTSFFAKMFGNYGGTYRVLARMTIRNEPF